MSTQSPDSGVVTDAALISVYDRTGVVPLARALAERGIADLRDRRHARAPARARHRRARRRRTDRLPVAVRRPREDAAPQRVRRHPQRPRQRGASRRGASSTASRRSRRSSSNLYPFEATVANETARRCRRRSSRSTSAASRCCARRRRTSSTSPCSAIRRSTMRSSSALRDGGLDRATRRRFATRAFERTAEYDSAIARYLESGMLAQRTARFARADDPDRAAAALRREPAGPRGVLPRARGAAARAARRQSALVQQPARSRRDAAPAGARAASRSRRSGRRGRAALRARPRAAIVKHTVPCGVAERAVGRRGGARSARRRSGLRLRRDHRGRRHDRRAPRPSTWPDSSSRSSPRRHSTTTRSRGSRKKKNLRIMRYRPARRSASRANCACAARSAACSPRTTIPQAPPERWTVVSKRQPTRERVARPRSSPGTSCGT